MENNEYVIMNRDFANAIKFMIGEKFTIVPHSYIENQKVFVFKDSALLRETISGLMTLRKQLNNK